MADTKETQANTASQQDTPDPALATADKKRLKRAQVAILCIFGILAFLFLKTTAKVTMPIVLAIYLYFVSSPIAEALERAKIFRRRMPRIVATLLTYLFVLFVVFVAFVVISTSVSLVVERAPVYIEKFNQMDRRIAKTLFERFEIGDGWSAMGMLNVNWAQALQQVLARLSSNVVQAVSVFVLVMLYLFFLMLERGMFTKRLLSTYTDETRQRRKIEIMLKRTNRQITRYLAIKFIASLITGSLVALWCFLVGVDFFGIWGVMAFVLNFIPSIGSILVTVLITFFTLLQYFPVFSPVIEILALVSATEMIIGNIIEPRFSGSKLNLSPFIVLASLALWGYIWGYVGMFLAVLLTSTLQIVCSHISYLRPVAKFISNKVDEPASGRVVSREKKAFYLDER